MGLYLPIDCPHLIVYLTFPQELGLGFPGAVVCFHLIVIIIIIFIMGCGTSTSTAARQPMSVGIVPVGGSGAGGVATGSGKSSTGTKSRNGPSSPKEVKALGSIRTIMPAPAASSPPKNGDTKTLGASTSSAGNERKLNNKAGPSNVWKLGEDRSPWGIATYENHVYVSDMVNHTITVYNRNDGREVRQWGGVEGDSDGELNQPSGMAWSKDGLLYVVDTGNARIQAFTPEGRFMRKWGKQGEAPVRIDIFYQLLTAVDVDAYVCHIIG
jgi:hypothetical protein